MQRVMELIVYICLFCVCIVGSVDEMENSKLYNNSVRPEQTALIPSDDTVPGHVDDSFVKQLELDNTIENKNVSSNFSIDPTTDTNRAPAPVSTPSSSDRDTTSGRMKATDYLKNKLSIITATSMERNDGNTGLATNKRAIRCPLLMPRVLPLWYCMKYAENQRREQYLVKMRNMLQSMFGRERKQFNPIRWRFPRNFFVNKKMVQG